MISLSLSLYIYIYIYIYICNIFPPAALSVPRGAQASDRKGTDGVSTNGVTANLVFFDRGTFRGLPLTYLYIPRRARAYLFPKSDKIVYLCSGPIGFDPMRPQPTCARVCAVVGCSVSWRWQPDGSTIHTKKWFLGAGFLGAPPISLKQCTPCYTYRYDT